MRAPSSRGARGGFGVGRKKWVRSLRTRDSVIPTGIVRYQLQPITDRQSIGSPIRQFVKCPTNVDSQTGNASEGASVEAMVAMSNLEFHFPRCLGGPRSISLSEMLLPSEPPAAADGLTEDHSLVIK